MERVEKERKDKEEVWEEGINIWMGVSEKGRWNGEGVIVDGDFVIGNQMNGKAGTKIQLYCWKSVSLIQQHAVNFKFLRKSTIFFPLVQISMHRYRRPIKPQTINAQPGATELYRTLACAKLAGSSVRSRGAVQDPGTIRTR